MKCLAVCALMLFPVSAGAATAAGGEFSFLASLLQMTAALALVVGLILLIWHFSGKLTAGRVGGRFSSRYIRVVETRYFGPKKAVMLIEVGGEYLLVALTDHNITLLKQIEMFEEGEIIEEIGVPREGFAGILDRLKS